MAWIKQASVLVAFVLAANAARLKRRGPTVLFLSFCLSQWSRLVGGIGPLGISSAVGRGSGSSASAVVPAIPQSLCSRSSKTSLFLKSCPIRRRSMFQHCRPATSGVESETMSLANSALIRLAAATAGVLFWRSWCCQSCSESSAACFCGSVRGGGNCGPLACCQRGAVDSGEI